MKFTGGVQTFALARANECQGSQRAPWALGWVGLNVAVMRDSAHPSHPPTSPGPGDAQVQPSTPPPRTTTALLEMYYPAPLVVSVMNAAPISGPAECVSPVFHNKAPPLNPPSPCVPPDLQHGGGGGWEEEGERCQASTKYAFRSKQRGVDKRRRVGSGGFGGECVVGVAGEIAFFCTAPRANMHHCPPPTNSR